MSETKILFTDLDGTLLDDNKNVSSEDLGSVNEMIRAGHRLVIATGRPLYSAKVVAGELGLYRDGIYLAASNGGVIFDCSTEKIIFACSVDFDTVRTLFEAAAKAHLHIQTYTDDYVVALKKTPEIEQYCTRIKMPYKILERIPEDLPAPPPKCIVMSIEDDSRHILEVFEGENRSVVSKKVTSVFSNDNLLEYLPLQASKGNAVKKLCELIGIDIADTVAAGDEANDIPMIEAAGIGAVMKNGTDETKSYADYVTEHTNNESGVSEIIRRFILN